jgi:hypothetical protein
MLDFEFLELLNSLIEILPGSYEGSCKIMKAFSRKFRYFLSDCINKKFVILGLRIQMTNFCQ